MLLLEQGHGKSVSDPGVVGHLLCTFFRAYLSLADSELILSPVVVHPDDGHPTCRTKDHGRIILALWLSARHASWFQDGRNNQLGAEPELSRRIASVIMSVHLFDHTLSNIHPEVPRFLAIER